MTVKVKVKLAQSCPSLQDSMDSPWNSPGQNAGVGSLSFLQGIFLTHGSNPSLPHCWADSLPAEPQGKPKNTGVVAISCSKESSWTRDRIRVSHLAGRLFTNWTTREAKKKVKVAQLCLTLCNPVDCVACQSPLSMEFSSKNTGMGSYSFLQGIFPTQGLNPGLPHCRQTLYPVSHEGNPVEKKGV